jgi:hypothetical protein
MALKLTIGMEILPQGALRALHALAVYPDTLTDVGGICLPGLQAVRVRSRLARWRHGEISGC